MNKLSLHTWHEQKGAQFKLYRDWFLPMHYGDTQVELAMVADRAGLVDQSYLGMVWLTGKDGPDLLQRISTNDLAGLPLMGSLETLFCTAKGRIVDRVRIINLKEGLLLVSSHYQAHTLSTWMEKFIIMEDASCREVRGEYIWLLLIGSKVEEIIDLMIAGSMNEHEVVFVNREEGSLIIIRNQDYRWPAFHLLFEQRARDKVLPWLESVLGFHKVGPVGFQAMKVLRLQSGVPESGSELNEKYNPHEARLLKAVSFTKGCYIGQEVIARLDTYDKVQRYLMCIDLLATLKSEKLPTSIYWQDERIGELTSYAYDPLADRHLGLGYVRKRFALADSELQVACGEYRIKGILKLPISRE